MYCGVRPQRDATLTIRVGDPSNGARLDGSPASVLTGCSKIDMAPQGTVTPMDISGSCDDRFAIVGDAFAGNFDADSEPAEVGASVAVTIEGELVVDLWARHGHR